MARRAPHPALAAGPGVNRGVLTGAAALVVVPLLVISIIIGALLLTPPPPPPSSCGPAGAATPVDLASLPTGEVEGYQGVQLANAAAIVNAGLALGLDAHGQTLGVMTAMGESDLIVVNYGDKAGPDSRGLFQQRANGVWGSYADRMDPTTSATNFYRALVAVPGWADLQPTIAAHRTQRNADPYHYEPYWPRAVKVVATLAASGAGTAPGAATVVTADLRAPITGAVGDCMAATAAAVTAEGWTKPAIAPITSSFGWRIHPVYKVRRLHAGTDLGARCGAPIMAAADGVVVQAGAVNGYGNLMVLDNGGGTTSRYAHMFADGILARVGEKVTAGQQIARVGSAGVGTACHLHFEIQQNGELTDPVPFMTARGAPLGL